ncbi:MAG: flippase-like domain-containing protein, partial [Prevotella sp.]|nr:flippase-like domain-containing protein [Candidatus Prevotella equi]
MSKQTLNNIFFFLGVAMVVVMLLTFDVSYSELWQHMRHAGWWMFAILGVWVPIYGLNAMAWYSIIKANMEPGEKVSFLRVFRLTITGYALNYATPVGGLGGEPYRIMELSRDIDKRRAASSVILYAMMHIFAHFWFWFTSIFLYLILYAIGDLPLNSTITFALCFIFVLCSIAFYLFYRGYKNGMVVKIIGWISHIPGLKGWATRFAESHSEALHKIDQQIASLHQQDKKAFYRSLSLEYVSRIVQSLEVMFMLLVCNIDCGGGIDGYLLTFLHSILIVAFTTLFANLIGFLPMQLGVQEGGFLLSIAAMGLTATVGFFVSLICRVREIIW